MIDGAPDEGWFASDFTLAEIKRLRAVQDFGDRLQQFNGKFEIATFEEIIDLVKRKSKEKGRTIGIYPGTKHPTYHQSIGLPLEGALIDTLKRAGWNRRDAPVFIQSFEQSNLKALRKMTPIRLVQTGGRRRRQPRRQPRLHGPLRPAVRLDGLERSQAARPPVQLFRHR